MRSTTCLIAIMAALTLVAGCSNSGFGKAFHESGTSDRPTHATGSSTVTSFPSTASAPATDDPSAAVTASGAGPTPTGTAQPAGTVSSLPGIKLDAPLPAPSGTYNTGHSDPQDGFAAYSGVSRAQYTAYLARLAARAWSCAAPAPLDGGLSVDCHTEQPTYQILTLTLNEDEGEVYPGLFIIQYTG